MNGLVIELGGLGEHGDGLFHVAHDAGLIKDSGYWSSE